MSMFPWNLVGVDVLCKEKILTQVRSCFAHRSPCLVQKPFLTGNLLKFCLTEAESLDVIVFIKSHFLSPSDYGGIFLKSYSQWYNATRSICSL